MKNDMIMYARVINEKYRLASELASQGIELGLHPLTTLLLTGHDECSEDVVISGKGVTVRPVQGFGD